MRLNVTVKANSKKGPLIEEVSAGNFIVFVQEPAIDGKANKAVAEIVAKHLKVAKSRIVLVRGHKSRQKVFEV